MTVDNLAVAIHGFMQNERRFEEAGIFYELRIIRDLLTLGLDTSPVLKRVKKIVSKKFIDCSDVELEDESALINIFDPDDAGYFKYLMSLDPKDWKNQDHYKVLGLSKLRWRASEAHIRSAYRLKVLKYHPDKRKSSKHACNFNREDYFICITKAYEQLGVSIQKRRAYDSVDPEFDDSVPDVKTINDSNFFSILVPVFQRNARWSKLQPVPQLGNTNSSREEVEKFYSFWFEWSSWREYSYLDEEDKETGQDRWEKREIEKSNKAKREARRKNELKRIRNLVEMSYKKDPRIATFKESDKKWREEEKKEKHRLKMEKKIEEEKAKLEIAMTKRKQEEQIQAEKKKKFEEEKKIKERMRKELNDARKALRTFAKTSNYWGSMLDCMDLIESFCFLDDVDHIRRITREIKSLSSSDKIIQFLSSEREKMVYTNKTSIRTIKGQEEKVTKSTHWTSDEINLVVKASNLFPAGTLNRWSEITAYVNEHRKDKSGEPRTEKEIITQARAIKCGYTSATTQPKFSGHTTGPSSFERDWTAEEQKALENALKAYSSSDPGRWDKIASSVGRTKKDCVKRFKYLAERVKAKKAQS